MKISLPNIIGHRGVKDLAPENTIPSFEESVRYNLKWIEVDVKISKDNIPFLLHDDLLDRTTSGEGYPYNYLYKEILNLDAGSWFDKKFSTTYPPTLEEVLIFCSNKRIGLNIELKPNQGKEKENVNAISYLIDKKKLNFEYYFSSFDYFSLKLMRSKMPNAALGYLIDHFDDNKILISIIKDCLNLKCFSIGFDLKLINKGLVKSCKERNLKVTVYSNKNIEYTTALELWTIGVDSIFIDNPIYYKKILDNFC